MLQYIHMLEFEAIGPVPWSVALLAELGASVTCIRRPRCLQTHSDDKATQDSDLTKNIGRRNIYLDLKNSRDISIAKRLVKEHDVLIEGMRPGVMERLGLGPAICSELNPSLVYARMTGWGQSGPLSRRAGHDINYIALSGALHAIGQSNGPPVIPLNLVGDYGGGGSFLLFGVMTALLKSKMTGQGTVVDAAMLDGATRQMGIVYEQFSNHQWLDQRGSNYLDGGCPWYNVYETKCGNYMAVGALEPQFYKLFLKGLDLDLAAVPDRSDFNNWNSLRSLFKERFRSQSRDYWCSVFDNSDACVSPVLSLSEAPLHHHNCTRKTFNKLANNKYKPGIVPRFSKLISN